MKKYLCYESETTGCCFAFMVVEEGYQPSGSDFLATKEECENMKICSRIPNFQFDWEKLDDSTR